jgi:ParB family transcriptional regulator, chromosome partitioning protein
MSKPALGRGLGALLGGRPANPVPPGPPQDPANPAISESQINGTNPENISPIPEKRDGLQRVAIDRIRPCPFQPRKDFSAEALKELADSIREQGIVQPLVVRDQGSHFELIAGERRWRAAQLVGLAEVPIIVREADDRAVLELALIENLQRENLNPIEEALGFSQLIEQFQLTQEEAATKVGKSRTVVANALRLLKLPSQVQAFVREGKLSVGHAKVILGLGTDRQPEAAQRILHEGLNVRQTEQLVAKWQNRVPHAKVSTPTNLVPLTQNSHVARIEDKLREHLGTKVQVRYTEGKGAVEISFFSDDELERVLEILGVRLD